jgi:hypothetical protein
MVRPGVRREVAGMLQSAYQVSVARQRRWPVRDTSGDIRDPST